LDVALRFQPSLHDPFANRLAGRITRSFCGGLLLDRLAGGRRVRCLVRANPWGLLPSCGGLLSELFPGGRRVICLVRADLWNHGRFIGIGPRGPFAGGVICLVRANPWNLLPLCVGLLSERGRFIDTWNLLPFCVGLLSERGRFIDI
jgi:hypothetical protein